MLRDTSKHDLVTEILGTPLPAPFMLAPIGVQAIIHPDAELATHYAREMYSRRQESVHLWVVRRGDIHDLADQDLLQPPLDRSFKKPGGYVMREKLAAARQISGEAKPGARAK